MYILTHKGKQTFHIYIYICVCVCVHVCVCVCTEENKTKSKFNKMFFFQNFMYTFLK